MNRFPTGEETMKHQPNPDPSESKSRRHLSLCWRIDKTTDCHGHVQPAPPYPSYTARLSDCIPQIHQLCHACGRWSKPHPPHSNLENPFFNTEFRNSCHCEVQIKSSKPVCIVVRVQTLYPCWPPRAVQIPTPPPTCCVCLDKSLKFSVSVPFLYDWDNSSLFMGWLWGHSKLTGDRVWLHGDFRANVCCTRILPNLWPQMCMCLYMCAHLNPTCKACIFSLEEKAKPKQELSRAMLNAWEFIDHFVHNNP